MKVLGIDPGIGRCGWAVLEENKGKIKAISFGCLETDSKTDVPSRLKLIHQEVIKIINKFSPEALSIEELFFNNNAKTAFVVGQARGVILLAASQSKVPVFIYTPLEVKVAVTGYGHAHKDQVGKMVKTLLLLKEVPKPDDTADALAVGLAHIFSAKISRLSK